MTDQYYESVGRRKQASARVRMYPGGDGSVAITINDKPAEEYLSRVIDQVTVMAPLKATSHDSGYAISVRVNGGGVTGQAGAIQLGIARALLKIDPDLRPILRKGGFLTRDARVKERKKPGLKRARKAPTYTKR